MDEEKNAMIEEVFVGSEASPESTPPLSKRKEGSKSIFRGHTAGRAKIVIIWFFAMVDLF